MQSSQTGPIKPLSRHGLTLSLHSANHELGVQETSCPEYIHQLNAVAVSEYKNPKEIWRNAAITLTSLSSDRPSKRTKWPMRHSGLNELIS